MTVLRGCRRKRRLSRKRFNAVPPLPQLLQAVVEQGEVIHVAQAALGPQHLLAEVVLPVQMQVGEELTGEVADGQPAPSCKGREQVVTGKQQMHWLLRV